MRNVKTQGLTPQHAVFVACRGGVLRLGRGALGSLAAGRDMKKGAPRKIRLAETLRRETTLRVGWTAREWQAGAPLTLWKALIKRKKDSAETRD